MKRKIMVAVMVVALSGTTWLAGCATSTAPAGSSAQEEAVQYQDEAFIQDLAKALQSRWKLNAQLEDSTDEKEAMSSFVKAELDVLDGYENALFEDSKLKEKAISYINCLKDQQAALDYYSADYEKYMNNWQKAYDERTKLITDFVNDYNLTVSEEYQSDLDDLLSNARAVAEKEQEESELDAIAKALEFTEEESYGEYTDYEATLENTTEHDFESISFEVQLQDEDGSIVDTQYIYAEHIKAGQKAKVTFTTDASFEKTEVFPQYWEFDD